MKTPHYRVLVTYNFGESQHTVAYLVTNAMHELIAVAVAGQRLRARLASAEIVDVSVQAVDYQVPTIVQKR